MDFLKKLSKLERALFASAILIALMCLFYLSPLGDQWISDHFSRNANDVEIGRIVQIQNDSRLRPKSQLSWKKSHGNQAVYVGDSIYSGMESSTQIEINKNGQVVVGENSLIVFDEVDRQKVADLQAGNFRLKVDGKLKIAVQGVMTEVKGKGSEIQIYMAKGSKPKLKVLKGEAQVQQKGEPPLALNSDHFQELSLKEVPATAASSPDSVAEFPVLQKQSQPLVYVWKLYDLFEGKDYQLIPRRELPQKVSVQHQFDWEKSSAQNYFELSRDQSFADSYQTSTAASSLEMNELFVGENFWRLSTDGQTWSEAEKIIVETKFLDNAQPTVQAAGTEVPLISDATQVPVHLQSPLRNSMGFVVQASSQPAFESASLRTFWSRSADVKLAFFKPGEYFYRFRTVSEQQELSEWSPTIRFHAFIPPLELSPVAETKIDSVPKKEIANIVPSEVRQPMAIKPVRKPSSIDNSSSLQTDIKPLRVTNEKYNSNSLSVNGLLWTMFSSEQVAANQSSPTASGVGVHGIYWRGKHGFEGSMKSGVFGLNEAGKSQNSLKDIEARYHYRFFTGFPWGLSRELQVSVFGGYEFYRNTGDVFSNQYDLLKFGTALEFPWSQRWMSGGEFVYGLGAGGAWKGEISGNVHYFLTTDWSFGVGYRIHLFNAGQSSQSPTDRLPYREGYTEGFSSINYHF